MPNILISLTFSSIYFAFELIAVCYICIYLRIQHILGFYVFSLSPHHSMTFDHVAWTMSLEFKEPPVHIGQ